MCTGTHTHMVEAKVSHDIYMGWSICIWANLYVYRQLIYIRIAHVQLICVQVAHNHICEHICIWVKYLYGLIYSYVCSKTFKFYSNIILF